MPRNTNTSTPRRSLSAVLGDRLNRPSDRDAVLKSIEGQEVEIAAVEIDWEHQGRFRKYPLTKVTLTDGRSFGVAGKAVAEPLSYLDEADFPIGARFTLQPSDFDPEGSYWSVE